MKRREDIEEYLRKIYPHYGNVFSNLYEIKGVLMQKKNSHFVCPDFHPTVFIRVEKEFGLIRDRGKLMCECGREEAQSISLIGNILSVKCFCDKSYIVNVN